MDVDAARLKDWTGARHEGAALPEGPLSSISTDTRSIKPGSAFVALRGERFDGHDFLEEAAAKGARVAVVSDPARATAALRKRLSILAVPDTLQAYGDLAAAYRRSFRTPVVAITGSSGKTTVKELVAHLASIRHVTLKNQGTENNLVGVPKTLLGLEPSHGLAVLELGTNRPGEIARLAQIVQPQIGLITLVAPSHLEGLGDLEGVHAEKTSLVPHVERGGAVVVNGDDARLSTLTSGVHRVVRAGSSPGADFRAEHVWLHEKGFTFSAEGQRYEAPLVGRHNVVNALMAVAVCRILGIPADELARSLENFRPMGGRLQWREIEGIRFLDDSYNANPASMRAAIETLHELKIRGRKGCVCGDMLELGAQSEALHRQIGALLAQRPVDFVIAVGPLAGLLADEAVERGISPTRIHRAADSLEAGRICRELAREGDCVLVKGSRGMKMEKVFECFTNSSIR